MKKYIVEVLEKQNIDVVDEKQYVNRKKVLYLICPLCNQKSSPAMS